MPAPVCVVDVLDDFLAPLVLSNGILRTLALHYTPVRADQAARDLRKKKTELISDAAQRRKIGQVEDTAASAELDDVLQQEADLTAGHGVLRITGLTNDAPALIAPLEQSGHFTNVRFSAATTRSAESGLFTFNIEANQERRLNFAGK